MRYWRIYNFNPFSEAEEEWMVEARETEPPYEEYSEYCWGQEITEEEYNADLDMIKEHLALIGVEFDDPRLRQERTD